MAVGIDYNSHVGALSINGKTIAVLGNGPDIIYPAQHKELASQIVEYGALVSDFLREPNHCRVIFHDATELSVD